MSAQDAHAWRPVVAALLNDTAREVYARIVLGQPLDAVPGSAARLRSAVAMLTVSGLIVDRDGELTADAAAMKRMLATAVSRPTGVERFLRADGRIDRYPTKAGERTELLTHVGAEVLEPGEVVGEAEVNERLARFADDIALLRRHLVDHGILERTRSGSHYALVEVGDDEGATDAVSRATPSGGR